MNLGLVINTNHSKTVKSQEVSNDTENARDTPSNHARTASKVVTPASHRNEENAYEKLSREVHEMQTNGGIHHDWLENPKGYLLKPDFKRKLQHVGAGGKKLQANISIGIRLHMPGSTYRTRWFVLDGMILRYFKTKNEDQELGAIHLASVNAVLPSSIADAPEHALDLVCADRIYTIAGNDREDMVRWATVLTLVLRGEYQPKLMQRPDSAIIRGSTAIQRPSVRKTGQLSFQPSNGGTLGQTSSMRFTDIGSLRRTGAWMDDLIAEEDVKEKIITVTFEQEGPLLLQLRGTVEDEVMVCGFPLSPDGSKPGLAQMSGVIRIGDFLISVNQYYFTNIEFDKATQLIRDAGRPLTLRFSRLERLSPRYSALMSTAALSEAPFINKRVAEGWVLAKEPTADRYRIRILQIYGDVLRLYKPSMQGVRAEDSCLVLKLHDVSDIRPTKDMREITSAYTQCHPKKWGITLEGQQAMFTFYAKSHSDMVQWIDFIKNSLLFLGRKKGSACKLSIPVHLVSVVQLDKAMEPRILLKDSIIKLGDLSPTLASYVFLLLEDGRILYFINDSQALVRTQPIAIIRCDGLKGIRPSQSAENVRKQYPAQPNEEEKSSFLEALWRLELDILSYSPSTMQNYCRSFVLYFESRDQMMKWAIHISREAARLMNREFDLSIHRKEPQPFAYMTGRNPQSFSGVSKELAPYMLLNQLKYIESSAHQSPPLYKSLKDATLHAAHRGWFFVRKPRSSESDPYHPRFLVLCEAEIYFFKYEIAANVDVRALPSSSHASVLDLRLIKDVREVESGLDEHLDFSIQLTVCDSAGASTQMLVAETFNQKEHWLSSLIWLSDYYYSGAQGAYSSASASSTARKQNGAMQSIPEQDSERLQSVIAPQETPKSSHIVLEDCTTIKGWLLIAKKKRFAAISANVFSYYKSEEEYRNEWGDAIGAIPLQNMDSLYSEEPGKIVMSMNSGHCIQLEAESAEQARLWMLIMSSCGDKILENVSDSVVWRSIPPKTAWIWKLDRVYQVFRRRFFSLRNHQLLFFTSKDGRPLGIVALSAVFELILSKICEGQSGTPDFYQLDISFADSEAPQTRKEHDPIGDFHALTMAFRSEKEMMDWAQCIHRCCCHSMSLKGDNCIPPLPELRVLPKELLKISTFEEKSVVPASLTSAASDLNARGWLYYLTAPTERIRLRYFVQWGYELSIYKHKVLDDEQRAIRYGVIDCRALEDVRFAYVNLPENAVELVFQSKIRVLLIPETDEEAVMWRDALLQVKRAHSVRKMSRETIGSGVYISRSHVSAALRENEDILRAQIESSVLFSSNLQEWDGRRWLSKYFVLTTSRVLVMSLAVHLYDEEPDLLASFASKYIEQVYSCPENETTYTKDAPFFTFVIVIRSISKDRTLEKWMLRCNSSDHCLEWMRLLCSSNGKLELKKNAATGCWASVNRIASMTQHQSAFIQPQTEPVPRGRQRLSRQKAAQRRTSEILMSRNLHR